MSAYIELDCIDGRCHVSRESMRLGTDSSVLELPMYVQETARDVAWESLESMSAKVAPKAATLTREVVEREVRAQWKLLVLEASLGIAKKECVR